MAAEKTSVVSAAPPQGVVDFIEMSGVFSAAATDVLALDATDVFSADTTDVFSAAKAADGGSCPAITIMVGLGAGLLAFGLTVASRDLPKTWFWV